MFSPNGLHSVADPAVGCGGGGRGEKHEIYVAAFSGHHFYDLFSQGQGAMAPSPPAGSTTAIPIQTTFFMLIVPQK